MTEIEISRIINLLGGDEVTFRLWKKLFDYHKRSLVETAFSRLKRLFGDRLNNRHCVYYLIDTIKGSLCL
jgi:hypothetical protein